MGFLAYPSANLSQILPVWPDLSSLLLALVMVQKESSWLEIWFVSSWTCFCESWFGGLGSKSFELCSSTLESCGSPAVSFETDFRDWTFLNRSSWDLFRHPERSQQCIPISQICTPSWWRFDTRPFMTALCHGRAWILCKEYVVRQCLSLGVEGRSDWHRFGHCSS